MPATTTYLAYDLGASSGRSVIGLFDGNRITLQETHRFPNSGVAVGENLYWDILSLFDHMCLGLRKTVSEHGPDLMGIGVDTWGVDYGLLDAADELLGNPRCYRDPRTQGLMDVAFETVPREEIFEQTGIQFMELNTLYQLLSMTRQQAPQLQMAKTFLTMPDLFNFWFTGQKVCEFSNATTTQFFNPRQQTWALDLLHRLNIPTDMLPEIVPPGTVLGPLRTSLAEGMGIKPVDVIAPACHDTGSAVAAVPMTDPQDSVYISCGTWALLGAEIAEPAITPKSLANNFTNEGGVCSTFRFLKNISGLWMVQECKRIWEQSGQNYSWAQLIQMASESPALISLVDPDHAVFLTPGDMPTRIRTACEQSGQSVPETEGAVIRAALESLALKCRLVLGQLEDSLERTMDRIHIVGGGIQNTLLCQFIANATGKTVLAGPIEATALGNILLQAMAKSQIGSLSEAREVVRNSTEIITYEPEDRDAWDEAFGRFQGLI